MADSANIDQFEEADDLLHAVREYVYHRRFGEVVRLETAAESSKRLTETLMGLFEIKEPLPGLPGRGDGAAPGPRGLLPEARGSRPEREHHGHFPLFKLNLTVGPGV